MKWCCMGFEAHVRAAGVSRFWVFVSMREDHKPIFVLQYRALDLGASIPHRDALLSLVTDVAFSSVHGVALTCRNGTEMIFENSAGLSCECPCNAAIFAL
jgi:hypothetical protein